MYVFMYGWEGRHSMDLSLRHLGLIFGSVGVYNGQKGMVRKMDFLMFESEGVDIFGDG
jgi:hypothetical protein